MHLHQDIIVFEQFGNEETGRHEPLAYYHSPHVRWITRRYLRETLQGDNTQKWVYIRAAAYGSPNIRIDGW